MIITIITVVFLAFISGLAISDIGDLYCKEPYNLTAYDALFSVFVFWFIAFLGFMSGKEKS